MLAERDKDDCHELVKERGPLRPCALKGFQKGLQVSAVDQSRAFFYAAMSGSFAEITCLTLSVDSLQVACEDSLTV